MNIKGVLETYYTPGHHEQRGAGDLLYPGPHGQQGGAGDLFYPGSPPNKGVFFAGDPGTVRRCCNRIFYPRSLMSE